jgi:hypothetical protein
VHQADVDGRPRLRCRQARDHRLGRQFAGAADLYATLFPRDKEIITVIYKNGQFFSTTATTARPSSASV